MQHNLYIERKLGGLAKKFRKQSGLNKSEAAKELQVHKATVSMAEERPDQSLTSLRIRMIEKYSGYKVKGPFYRLVKK